MLFVVPSLCERGDVSLLRSRMNDRLRGDSRDGLQVNQSEDQLRDLMVRYQQGDAAAVETLVRNSSPALLRFCSGPGMSRTDAEDLLTIAPTSCMSRRFITWSWSRAC